MKKLAPIAVVGLLVLTGAGCSQSQAPQPTPEAKKNVPAAAEKTVPAAPAEKAKEKATVTFTGSAKAKLSAKNISFSEKNEMEEFAKLKSGAAVSEGLKLKVSGGTGSVRVLLVTVSDASKTAAVKAEMKAQYDELAKQSSSIRFSWLTGDATHIALVYYSVADQALAEQVIAALNALAASEGVQAVAEIKNADDTVDTSVSIGDEKMQGTAFKVGEKVIANWKKGDKWWGATVTAIDGPAVTVTYEDGIVETLGSISVAHIPSAPAKVKVGDKVVAKWSGGGYWNATVTELLGTKATVTWSDKTTQEVLLTDIAFGGK